MSKGTGLVLLCSLLWNSPKAMNRMKLKTKRQLEREAYQPQVIIDLEGARRSRAAQQKHAEKKVARKKPKQRKAKRNKPVKRIPDFYRSEEWLDIRYRVLKRDGARCACCGATRADDVRMNVDHIKPRYQYPHLELDMNNLQVLCELCNQGKGGRDKTDWRGLLPDQTPPPQNRSRAG